MLCFFFVVFFFFKHKTAYEMSISDWSSDVCSSDLLGGFAGDATLGDSTDPELCVAIVDHIGIEGFSVASVMPFAGVLVFRMSIGVQTGPPIGAQQGPPYAMAQG